MLADHKADSRILVGCTTVGLDHAVLKFMVAVALSLLEEAASKLARGADSREGMMSDVVFVGVTIVFFAVAWAYTLGCDRL